MTDAERAEMEELAEQVCPHTYQGWPCEQPAGHPGPRHWCDRMNWPAELSDQNVERAAS